MESQFFDLCENNGNIDELKKQYKNGNISECIMNAAFRRSCSYGNLNIAQWLYSLGSVDIHSDDEYAFKWSCYNGHLNIAQWLYSLGGVNIHADNNDAFRWSCYNGYLNIAQWLYSIGDIYVNAENYHVLRASCCKGHLNIVKWLYSITGTNYTIKNDAFKWAYAANRLNIVQWLYSFDNIDVHIDNDLFELGCINYYMDMTKWALSVSKFDDKIVDKNLPEELYDYAFSLGYLPVNNMKIAYAEYKKRIKYEIKEKNENGNIGVFELSYIVDIIILYI